MIDYSQFTPISALIGGAFIGFSSLSLLLFNGRISGISGITAQLMKRPQASNFWAWVFISGMFVGAALSQLSGNLTTPDIDSSWLVIIIAGLLVGAGTSIGSGCTSGHAICGIGRFSTRSIIATCTFLISGAISLYLSK